MRIKYNKRLVECIACFFEDAGRCNKQKLPRKKKKLLKKYYPILSAFVDDYHFDYFNSCELETAYRTLQPLFNKIGYIKKYYDVLEFLAKQSAETWSTEPICLNEHLRLCWVWESDDDYGGTSGLMEFVYEKLPNDNTWAYEELCDLVKDYFDVDFEILNIKSDKDLLDYMLKNRNVIDNVMKQIKENELEYSELPF